MSFSRELALGYRAVSPVLCVLDQDVARVRYNVMMVRVSPWDRNRPAPDLRALRTARALQGVWDDTTVILFGSRTRRDWNDYSDIDLMRVGIETTRRVAAYLPPAYRAACQEYGPNPPAIDVKCLSRQDFREQVIYSRNRIGAVAYREGIVMDGYMPPLREPGSRDPHPENSERMELEERLTDAHLLYDDMHMCLDNGRYTKNCVFHAHQALEHGLKALIVAQERAYPRIHALTQLAKECRLELQSDLQLLAEYAGGPRYAAPPFPSIDFIQLANALTDDLTVVFQHINERTGMNPWAMEHASGPRYRPASPRSGME